MVRKLHVPILFFLLVPLFSCSPSLVRQDQGHQKEALTAGPPEWVSRKPGSSIYYMGIGHVSKAATDSYRQAAKKAALQDLVSEIKVTISSNSLLFETENDYQFKQQYQSKIMTKVTDEIEEFELVDTWEDEHSYWVYYRLSKQDYEESKARKRRNAQNIALDYFKKGKGIENGDSKLALGYYLQAFYHLRDYLDDANKVYFEGKEILLGNEVYAAAQLLLRQIRLTTGAYNSNTNRRLIEGLSIPVFASSDRGKPLSHMPLKAEFDIGQGVLHPTYTTGTEGRANIIISSIGSKEAKQKIRVSLDMETLSKSSGDEVYALLMEKIVGPQAMISLQVQKPSVHISAQESILGKPAPTGQISNKLKALMSSAGFTFSSEKKSSDLWVELSADTAPGPVSGSIHITYLTLNIAVVDAKTGQEVYSAGLDKIKGFSLDYQRSSREAYDKSLELLEESAADELIEAVLR